APRPRRLPAPPKGIATSCRLVPPAPGPAGPTRLQCGSMVPGSTTPRRSAGWPLLPPRTGSPSTNPLAGAPAFPSDPAPRPSPPNPPAWRVRRFRRPPMTEPTQAPALVENMLLLRREDFDDLLDSAAERGAERVLAHLGIENGH